MISKYFKRNQEIKL